MRTIIFDFDGTVADSFETLLEVFQSIIKGGPELSPARVEQLRGMQIKNILGELKVRRWQIPRLLMRGRKAITERMDSIKPIAGLPEALRKLHDSGYSLIILSTNSAVNINKFLAGNDMNKLFTSVHGGVGIFNKAAALKKLIKKEHLDIDECVYVGDELRDIEAGQNAGIKYISVAWGFNTEQALKQAKPMRLIERPEQLAPAVVSMFDMSQEVKI